MVKRITGDLLELALEGRFTHIIHGCNCFNTMGAGIAKQIATRFPQAAIVDRETVKGSIDKLGGYTIAYIPEKQLYVVNLYTQFQPGANFDLIALNMGLTKLVYNLPHNVQLGLPLIGAGIGGGNWASISKVIREKLWHLDTTIVKLP